jgi:TPR repeat protein
MYNYAQLLAHGRGVEQDRTTALTWFRLAASRGHARAMNFVGMYCENGWGTLKDRYAAEAWYQRSAQGGDFRGQCSYASILTEQGRMEEAVAWLQKAATTATPRFLSELATVLKQSPHAALRAFADELRA